jgi:hypothetical protein
MLMQGRIWSGFAAVASVVPEDIAPGGSSQVDTDPPPIPLVAKFTAPKEHPLYTSDVVTEARREAWLYERVLADLQGSVVPSSHGIFYAWQASHGGRATTELLCALLEYAGVPLDEARLSQLTGADK